MKLQFFVQYARLLCITGLLLVCVAYAASLVWQEMRFRQRFAGPSTQTAAVAPPQLREALDATAIASVMGLAPQASVRASAESLTLQACFVASVGLSKALLRNSQGPRLYRVGEALPGGSVLRRIEQDHVVLWNKAREERLLLQPSAYRFLRKLESTTTLPAPVVSMRFLRPVAGQTE